MNVPCLASPGICKGHKQTLSTDHKTTIIDALLQGASACLLSGLCQLRSSACGETGKTPQQDSVRALLIMHLCLLFVAALAPFSYIPMLSRMHRHHSSSYIWQVQTTWGTAGRHSCPTQWHTPERRHPPSGSYSLMQLRPALFAVPSPKAMPSTGWGSVLLSKTVYAHKEHRQLLSPDVPYTTHSNATPHA